MAADNHSPQSETATPPRPPRSLRRVGLAAAVAAIAIAAFGILERRGHEAEVKKWTQEQAIPTVAVIAPHAAR